MVFGDIGSKWYAKPDLPCPLHGEVHVSVAKGDPSDDMVICRCECGETPRYVRVSDLMRAWAASGDSL